MELVLNQYIDIALCIMKYGNKSKKTPRKTATPNSTLKAELNPIISRQSPNRKSISIIITCNEIKFYFILGGDHQWINFVVAIHQYKIIADNQKCLHPKSNSKPSIVPSLTTSWIALNHFNYRHAFISPTLRTSECFELFFGCTHLDVYNDLPYTDKEQKPRNQPIDNHPAK